MNLMRIIETIDRLTPLLIAAMDDYNVEIVYNNIIIDHSIYLMNCITTLVNQLERLENLESIDIDLLLTDTTLNHRGSRLESFIDAGITAVLHHFTG